MFVLEHYPFRVWFEGKSRRILKPCWDQDPQKEHELPISAVGYHTWLEIYLGKAVAFGRILSGPLSSQPGSRQMDF